MNELPIYDVGIVGTGPVGIYASFYAGYHGLKTIAFDTLPELGGQLVNLYPEKWIFDVGGHVKVFAKDYIQSLLDQAAPFSPEYHVSERVEGLERVSGELDAPLYKMKTGQREVLVRSVLIAGGMGAYMPRKLDLPDVDSLEGRGIHYKVLSKERFRDKRVMIVGGGDSAVDWAINLQGVAKKIWAVHRSRQFKALEASVEEMIHETATEILLPYEVKALQGDSHLTGVTLIHAETGEERTWDVDELLLMIGLMANLGPIEAWGLHVKWNGLVVDHYQQTNLRAVYAIGDIAKYDGKVNLIAAGNGEASTAIEHAIAKYLHTSTREREWLDSHSPHDH